MSLASRSLSPPCSCAQASRRGRSRTEADGAPSSGVSNANRPNMYTLCQNVALEPGVPYTTSAYIAMRCDSGQLAKCNNLVTLAFTANGGDRSPTLRVESFAGRAVYNEYSYIFTYTGAASASAPVCLELTGVMDRTLTQGYVLAFDDLSFQRTA